MSITTGCGFFESRNLSAGVVNDPAQKVGRVEKVRDAATPMESERPVRRLLAIQAGLVWAKSEKQEPADFGRNV